MNSDFFSTAWHWFYDPMQFQFMQRAVLTSAFIGLVCAVLSCFVILKGWSLLGDALSHAVLPGVVLSYVIGIPFAIGAFVAGVLSVSAIGYIGGRTRLKNDTVIGIVFTGFFALGLILTTKVVSTVHFTHILLGSVLGISDNDIVQTLLLGSITLVLALLIFRRDLMLFCFDELHAQSLGINVRFLAGLLLVLLSLTVVSAFQTVGVILVVAMLVTPGAIAYLLTDDFDRMLIIASISSVFSCIVGTFFSYHINASTGGSIVVTLTSVFAITMVFAPKHGILAQSRKQARTSFRAIDTVEIEPPVDEQKPREIPSGA